MNPTTAEEVALAWHQLDPGEQGDTDDRRQKRAQALAWSLRDLLPDPEVWTVSRRRDRPEVVALAGAQLYLVGPTDDALRASMSRARAEDITVSIDESRDVGLGYSTVRRTWTFAVDSQELTFNTERVSGESIPLPGRDVRRDEDFARALAAKAGWSLPTA